jgi:hypothetical protein
VAGVVTNTLLVRVWTQKTDFLYITRNCPLLLLLKKERERELGSEKCMKSGMLVYASEVGSSIHLM